jgi:hypothetical protein
VAVALHTLVDLATLGAGLANRTELLSLSVATIRRGEETCDMCSARFPQRLLHTL